MSVLQNFGGAITLYSGNTIRIYPSVLIPGFAAGFSGPIQAVPHFLLPVNPFSSGYFLRPFTITTTSTLLPTAGWLSILVGPAAEIEVLVPRTSPLRIAEIVPGDTVHVVFALGYAAQYIAGNTRELFVQRYKNNRANFITAVVGRVVAHDVQNKQLTVQAGVPYLANMSLHGIPNMQRLDRSSARVTFEYRYMRRIELLQPNNVADFGDEPIFTSPGQRGLGAERYRPRLFRARVVW